MEPGLSAFSTDDRGELTEFVTVEAVSCKRTHTSFEKLTYKCKQKFFSLTVSSPRKLPMTKSGLTAVVAAARSKVSLVVSTPFRIMAAKLRMEN